MGFSNGSAIKNPPTMQEMQAQSLGQEYPLEEEMVTHSSILAWEIPWREESGSLSSIVSQRVECYWLSMQAHRIYGLMLRKEQTRAFLGEGAE